MSYRLTEEEGRAQGFVKDKKGNWHPPGVQIGNSASVSKLERGNTRQRKKPDSASGDVQRSSERSDRKGTYLIQIVARSRREIDTDNLCAKYFIDSLVRAGVLPDDSCRFITKVTYEVERISNDEEESTLIEIWQLT